MPTLINAVAGNSDNWETSHSVSIDVGTAQAGRRIVGFLGRYTDAIERITAASQITLAGSSTGVTLAGTATNPTGQAGTFYARYFDIDVLAGLAGAQTLQVSASDATARRIFIIAACYSSAGVPTLSYGSNAFNNNPTATISSATGSEVGLLVMATSAGVTLTPGTGSSAITGASGGTNASLFGLREDGAASVTIDGTFAVSEQYCCVAFSLPAGGAAATRIQAGFRYGNDDGAEGAHTHAAAENTNITAPASQARLLNLLVDLTGSPGATTLKLQVALDGTENWSDIPVQ